MGASSSFTGAQVGSIIGRGGEIVKLIRDETKSKVRVCDPVPTCDDRVIVIAARDDDPSVDESNAQVTHNPTIGELKGCPKCKFDVSAVYSVAECVNSACSWRC